MAGIGETLSHKIGPLPVYAWVVIGGVAGWWFLRKSGGGGAQPASTNPTGTTLVPFDTSGGGSMGSIIGGGSGGGGGGTFPTGGGGNGGGTGTGGGGTPLPGGGSGNPPNTPVPTAPSGVTCQGLSGMRQGSFMSNTPFQPINPLTLLPNAAPCGVDSANGFYDGNGTYWRKTSTGFAQSAEGGPLQGGPEYAAYLATLHAGEAPSPLPALFGPGGQFEAAGNADTCGGGGSGYIGQPLLRAPDGTLVAMCPGGAGTIRWTSSGAPLPGNPFGQINPNPNPYAGPTPPPPEYPGGSGSVTQKLPGPSGAPPSYGPGPAGTPTLPGGGSSSPTNLQRAGIY